MFDADRPITVKAEDRLGRSEFANYLAHCILDHKNLDSLVIGLQGDWASGKTSLINLIIQELNYASSYLLDAEKPVILNFSPWSYSGQNQLIYGFFRRLSLEIKRSPYVDDPLEITQLIELYASFFTNQPVPRSFRPKQKLLSSFQKSKSEKYQNAWEAGMDPTLVKAKLNEVLRQHKHKIIIFIDNISRLEAKEMLQVLQIVKSMADYVNTVFVLAYQPSLVIQAIDQISFGTGKQTLEKLIQLPFDVPNISKQDIENLLLNKLKKILEVVPADAWNNQYWSDVFYSSLKYFFNNARDITRYVNTLSFSFLRVKDVVNPVDFFALTALEVFEPRIYLAIRENKDLFTDLLENVYVFDDEKIKKDKLRCDEILQRSQNNAIHILQRLLITLFPRLRSMYVSNESFYHNQNLARKNKRVCTPDIFDVYFRLSIPTGFMPESEVETILAMSYDGDSFAEALLRLNQDGRAIRFLSLLDSNLIYKIPKKNISKVVRALLDCGDLFPPSGNNILKLNTDERVHRVINQLLKSLATTDERYDALLNGIRNANKSLYILVYELLKQADEHGENTDYAVPVEHRTITTEQLVKLQSEVAERIEFWSKIDRLPEHPRFLDILYAWKRWGNGAACENYVKSLVQNERGVIALLTVALHQPIEDVLAKQQKENTWMSSLENISNFIHINLIAPKAIEMFESDEFEKLREREQLAILIFLDLINAKTTKVIPKTTV